MFIDRLRIKDLYPSDAPTLYAYRSDATVARFQSWVPGSVEEARAFISRNAATPFDQHDSWYQFAIRLAATDELIGDLGVHFVGDDGQQVEIGVTIAPPHQRQGNGTLAVVAILELLFMERKKHRAFASVDPRNAASLALLTRVGMRQEAHFHKSLFFKGEWVDDVVFGLLRSEWTSCPIRRILQPHSESRSCPDSKKPLVPP